MSDTRIEDAIALAIRYGGIDGDHHKIVRKVSAEWGDVPRARVEIRSVA